jgi:hypothetical protein
MALPRTTVTEGTLREYDEAFDEYMTAVASLSDEELNDPDRIAGLPERIPGWRPWRVLAGAYLFGAVTILQLHTQAISLAELAFLPGWLYRIAELVKSIPSQFLSALPYLATVIVLVLISRNRRLTMMNTPASLGQPFVPDR